VSVWVEEVSRVKKVLELDYFYAYVKLLDKIRVLKICEYKYFLFLLSLDFLAF